jgi:CheY-like chemotaxis protein
MLNLAALSRSLYCHPCSATSQRALHQTNNHCSRLILCVDDDVDSCAAFKARLSGYHVTVAHTPDMGTGLARRFPFDVYLLNAALPDAGALKFCRFVKRFDPNTPIFAYNAPDKYKDRAVLMVTGKRIYFLGYSTAASLTAMLASAIESCWIESLTARVTVRAAVLDDLKNRPAMVRARMWNRWQQSQDLRARIIRGKAYRAFTAAGGNRANFARMLAENSLMPWVSRDIRESGVMAEQLSSREKAKSQ